MESCRARLLVQFPTALQVFLCHEVKFSAYIYVLFFMTMYKLPMFCVDLPFANFIQLADYCE